MKVTINGIDLGYEDHGIGLPVIFLHAFPLHRQMWAGVVTSLLEEQRYRLVAPDVRGFGESGLQTDVTTMELVADDIAALLDQLGMQRAVLCGLSMGGYIALAFLRKYAARVQGLILADTRPGADDEEGKVRREQLAQLAETQGAEAVADAQVPRLLAEHTRHYEPEVETRVRQMINAAHPYSIASAARGMAERRDQTEIVKNAQCPVMVIVGEHDAVIPPDIAKAYASEIPGARVEIIPRAGHLSNLEQPEAFLHAIRSFLETI